MTSKIKYPTILRPLIYSGLSTALHNGAYCDIYEWNSVCSTPLASYDITTEKQWRRKSCILTIWRPLIYSGLSTALHNCAYCDIYEWNSVCSTPLASYDITTEKQWRRKSSIPLFDAPWFIWDSQLHCTTVHIVTYTSEIVSAAHHLQGMASQQRRQWRRKSSIPTIWRPLIYSGLSTALHNCAYCDIYEWNSVC